MLEARIISLSIDRNWKALYNAVWRPEQFPRWAEGLSQSALRQDGEDWTGQGPEGPIRIRFTPHNAFGVMDHTVEISPGVEIRVPLRIVQNGEGAEVMLTLFRQPGVSDEKFAEDIEWVTRDLNALKALAGEPGL